MRLLYDDMMLPWLCLDIGQVNVASFRVLFSVHSLPLFYLGLSNLSLSLSPAWMIHAFVRPSVRDTYFSYFVFFSCSIMRMYYICLILVFCSVLFCSLSSFFNSADQSLVCDGLQDPWRMAPCNSLMITINIIHLFC